ncbi:MAG: hypothetical protein ACFCVD_18755 [Nodosilinea sp.]
MALFTDTLTNSWADALQGMLLTPIQTWLAEHPFMAWLVRHPPWALALVVVSILLFAGLWSAIARLTEGFWLTLVRLPFQLGSWLFVTMSGILLRRWPKPQKPDLAPDRLAEIMGRLDMLQTEQEGLLAEMRRILDEGDG